MDSSELHRSLYKALSDIQHSVEGALILGRHASNSVARLQALCEDVIKNFGVTGHVTKVNASNSSDSQHSGMKIPAFQVNAVNGAMGDRNQDLLSADQHVKLRNAKVVQRTNGEALQTCEPMAIHQSLRAANARLLGLVENLDDSHKNRFEQERRSLEDTIQQQAAQLAAREAQIASDRAEIAAKDAEISLLKCQDQVLKKVESSLSESAAIPKFQESFVTQSLESRGMSTQVSQSMALRSYLVPTLEQQKYKQIALAKEQDSKDAFESFMRTTQNSNSGLYEKLTDSSGHYVSPFRSTNPAFSIQDQPRKVPEKRLNPETPAFMPSTGRSTMPSIANTQNEPRKLLRAPAGPPLEAIVESTGEDMTEAQIKEKVASANGESAVDSKTVLPNTSSTTVKEMAMHDRSASANNDVAVSLPNIDASFDTFVEQQLQASTPISAGSSAEVSQTIADSPSRSTRGLRLPQEPRGVDDLIDLSSNATSPPVSKESVFRNAATDSAAYVAAATSVYSSFNADSYARHFKTESFSEEDSSEVTNTDQETSSDGGQFVWDHHGYSGPVSFFDRLNKIQSTSPESKASIRRFFSQAYAKMNPSTNPWSHDDVNQYVIRPGSRGTCFEMLLNWVPAEGRSYYLLDPKEPLLGWDGQAWRWETERRPEERGRRHEKTVHDHAACVRRWCGDDRVPGAY